MVGSAARKSRSSSTWYYSGPKGTAMPIPPSPSSLKYRHYKPKDLAVVRIDGRDHYLGRYNSPESHERYHHLLAERAAGSVVGSVVASTLPPPDKLP